VELAEGAELPVEVTLVRGEAPAAPPAAAPKAPRRKAAGAPAGAPGGAPAGTASVPSQAPPRPDAALERQVDEAVRLYERGDLDAAIAALEEVLRREPEHARAKRYLALARERRARAVEQWRQQLEEAPVTGGRKR